MTREEAYNTCVDALAKLGQTSQPELVKCMIDLNACMSYTLTEDLEYAKEYMTSLADIVCMRLDEVFKKKPEQAEQVKENKRTQVPTFVAAPNKKCKVS